MLHFSRTLNDNFASYHSEREQEREEMSRQTKCRGWILRHNVLVCSNMSLYEEEKCS